MKTIYFIIFIFYSCIDIIAPLNENHSLYFKGGGWVEIPQQSSDNDISVINNRFTLQFWVAGDSINTEESPALFSIVDSGENIIFGFFRDPHNNNSIDIYINNELKTIDTLINQFDVLDWSKPDQFYLISIISNQLNNIYDYGETRERRRVTPYFRSEKSHVLPQVDSIQKVISPIEGRGEPFRNFVKGTLTQNKFSFFVKL